MWLELVIEKQSKNKFELISSYLFYEIPEFEDTVKLIELKTKNNLEVVKLTFTDFKMYHKMYSFYIKLNDDINNAISFLKLFFKNKSKNDIKRMIANINTDNEVNKLLKDDFPEMLI